MREREVHLISGTLEKHPLDGSRGCWEIVTPSNLGEKRQHHSLCTKVSLHYHKCNVSKCILLLIKFIVRMSDVTWESGVSGRG